MEKRKRREGPAIALPLFLLLQTRQGAMILFEALGSVTFLGAVTCIRF